MGLSRLLRSEARQSYRNIPLAPRGQLALAHIPSFTLSFILKRNMSSVSAKPQDFGNFKLLQSFPVPYAPLTVSKWRSIKTGLTVVLGSHDSPVVRSVSWVFSTA